MSESLEDLGMGELAERLDKALQEADPERAERLEALRALRQAQERNRDRQGNVKAAMWWPAEDQETRERYRSCHARRWWARYVGGPKMEVRTDWTRTLSKAEAAHYLWGLENGFSGTWKEYVEENPMPEPPVQEVVLVRGGYSFGLYAVHRETAQRVYGQEIPGCGGRAYLGEFVDKAKIIKRGATEEDLAAVEAARRRMEIEKRQAFERYRAALDEIREG